MKDIIYMKSASAVCAQDIFRKDTIPDTLATTGNNVLNLLEPDYRQYFSIMQLRRMSKLTKAGLVTAIEALRQSGIEKPEAIITGTGKGSLTDTEKFLKSIDEFEEGTLNPSPFIQSTYNSLNGLIGLHHDVDCYNTTYVHRGFSLEHAILDAILQIREHQISNALVGSFEEITTQHFTIKHKLGYWRKEKVAPESLFNTDASGSIAGEGTFFFTLSAAPENSLAEIRGLRLLFEPDHEAVAAAMKSLLTENQLTIEDVDVVVSGRNGDNRFDHYYDALESVSLNHTHITTFKNISGEFDTASGFALWMAASILKNQEIHPQALYRKGTTSTFRHLLIYNHFYGEQHALYLLKK
ncbi:beta-ketoacyl synthase chain length factor [Flavihumibacter petaseus]|uniref:3-oxoacyl-[acyl-carrier-protein] synthase II n=1 Tax=Flavihumibacter petaseus NBRC 106054 TaxID=1220578 RepID=A0A0E9MUS9_9BACT|nr:beta-ketoacyl synthase chain length factor [Flavihumibacter petaseus]GAO41181.1 3-oxoacyl-[acyl-carrier-protein] synthase II [Flavihumibacter petaseus NBRC 106054]